MNLTGSIVMRKNKTSPLDAAFAPLAVLPKACFHSREFQLAQQRSDQQSGDLAGGPLSTLTPAGPPASWVRVPPPHERLGTRVHPAVLTGS